MWHEDVEVVRLTREELYELVWQKPLSRIVDEFARTDTGLAKRCRKLRVPHPGVGVWAKLQAGQKVVRPRLPPPRKGGPLEITVYRRIKAPPVETGKAPTFGKVLVPPTLEAPHPLVEQTRTSLMKAKVVNGLIVNDRDECAD